METAVNTRLLKKANMSKVIDLADERFNRLNAAKIVAVCNMLDAEVQKLIFEQNIPPHELLPALCQRIGVYLSCTDADKEKVVKKLSKIIYKYASA